EETNSIIKAINAIYFKHIEGYTNGRYEKTSKFKSENGTNNYTNK
ncbi:13256_t:CDS:1, partial [Funneliformis caledonium]